MSIWKKLDRASVGRFSFGPHSFIHPNFLRFASCPHEQVTGMLKSSCR